MEYGIFIVYLIAVAGGVGWVVYRAFKYVESEKEREEQWSEMASDTKFKSFVDNLRAQKRNQGAQPQEPPTGEDDSYRPNVYKLQ